MQKTIALPHTQFSTGKTCTKCAHLNVCLIFRAIAPMISQNYQDEATKPFNPEELAAICKAYVCGDVLKILASQEESRT